MKRLSVVIAALTLIAAGAFAQGKDALPFTRIDLDPVSSGMAGASVSSTGTAAWTGFRNAAVLPFHDGSFDAAASYQMWAPNGPKASHINAGAAYRFSDRFGLALGFTSQSGEAYDVLDDVGSVQGSFTPKDMVIGLGLGIGISERFSLGINARYATQKLSDDDSYQGVSGDVYALYRATDALDITVGLSTLGTSVESSTREKFKQPASLLAAASYQLAINEQMGLQAHLAGDYYFSGNYGFALGAQYDWNRMIFARAGYRLASKEAVIPSHLALGIGGAYKGIRLDLSYLTASKSIGNTLTIGLGYSF